MCRSLYPSFNSYVRIELYAFVQFCAQLFFSLSYDFSYSPSSFHSIIISILFSLSLIIHIYMLSITLHSLLHFLWLLLLSILLPFTLTILTRYEFSYSPSDFLSPWLLILIPQKFYTSLKLLPVLVVGVRI